MHKDYTTFDQALNALVHGGCHLDTIPKPAELVTMAGRVSGHLHGQTVNKLRRERLIKGKAHYMTATKAASKMASMSEAA
ncbi:MAG TPA: hypothetical protein VJ997_02785 [Longimicrobiales bacterium]|nr:hypothetical protein [Longimicrobiales bacterium]